MNDNTLLARKLYGLLTSDYYARLVTSDYYARLYVSPCYIKFINFIRCVKNNIC